MILLGPQLRYALQDIKRLVESKGKHIPIDVIDSVSYGTINGQKVLEQILELLSPEPQE